MKCLCERKKSDILCLKTIEEENKTKHARKKIQLQKIRVKNKYAFIFLKSFFKMDLAYLTIHLFFTNTNFYKTFFFFLVRKKNRNLNLN